MSYPVAGLLTVLLALLLCAGLTLGAYWVVRLGVRHALRDARKER